MANPKHTVPPIHIRVRLDEKLVDTIDEILKDPLRGRSRYGERSNLVTQLYKRWLRRVRYDEKHRLKYTGKRDSASEDAVS